MKMRIMAPCTVKGCITLPSSKSISNRLLVINALSGNKGFMPDNVSDCDDTRVMIDWLSNRPDVVDIKAAGTAMRFSSAMLAVSEGEKVITGSERMRQRPIKPLVDVLLKLGADVSYVENEGFPPLRIKGKHTLNGGCVSMSGNVSSQYISAILMIAPTFSEGLTLELTGGVISRPYIDLTISLMRDYGADVCWTGDNVIRVEPKPYVPRPYYVESDWSASSYWYEMVALCDDAEVYLPALFHDSCQGDSKVAEIFELLGVGTDYVKMETDGGRVLDGVRLYKTGEECNRLDYDFVNQPDLAQTFVVCCCMMGVPFRFTGLQSLKIKETDRISALCNEMVRLGYVIGTENDSVMFWDGERCEGELAPAIDTYEDHRMAMAFAPCALKLGEIIINDPHVVSKSYPKYWDDLKSVGFVCE